MAATTTHSEYSDELSFAARRYEATGTVIEVRAGESHVGDACTLNGAVAIISRYRDSDGWEGGQVSILPDGRREVYAWATIARVMAQGGKFLA